MNTQHVGNWLFRLEIIVISVTAIALILLALATQGMDAFEKVHKILMLVSVSGIVILFGIVAYYVARLLRNYLNKTPGAGLSINLLLRTLFLSAIPILFISYFAVQFTGYRFQATFDQRIDDALNNSLTLSEKTLEERRTQAINNTQEVARIILASKNFTRRAANPRLISHFDGLRQYLNFDELTFFDQNGFVVTHSSKSSNRLIPTPTSANEIILTDEIGTFNVVESIENGFQIRTVVRYRDGIDLLDKSNRYYVQSVILIPDSLANLTKQVRETVNERDKFNYLRPRVNSGFIFVLTLMTLLSLLFLILSSVALSDYMVKPIRELIRATVKVRKGDFELATTDTPTRKDDFGTLLKSFNLMTNSLRDANSRAETSQKQVESQRAYLATVIQHISSPVITLNQHRELLMFNEQAERLLAMSLRPLVKNNAASSGSYLALMQQLDDDFHAIKETGQSFTKEVMIDVQDESIELFVKMAELPQIASNAGGFVIMFEPMAEFRQRERAQAWSEVARRLAHEIKNPLTPIQLATERLNYKLSSSLDEDEQQILKKSTNVIINQVKAMQNIVDDFSQFAKPTAPENRTCFEVEPLLNDVIALYESDEGYQLRTEIKTTATCVRGESVKLRQVLHNVIKNAIEATQAVDTPMITVRAERQDNQLVISIEDNGIGLPNNKDKAIFEPYVTTKEKGTGLGLAIVKKIMTEHNGSIVLQNNLDAGVTVQLVLPIVLLNSEKPAKISA